MIRGAIYIDDSGNPGAESGSDFLPSARKSWTAVIVPSVIAARVQAGMDIFLNGVRDEFGVAELHFTEIFSNKGAWRRVSVQRRAEVIKLMAVVMAKLGLPIGEGSHGRLGPRRYFAPGAFNVVLGGLSPYPHHGRR
ncbi:MULTISPECIES: hypothetical protein [unclassified Rhizobium]|uniref:hypothetical protein n=1 Tax=unclassified Rhizobium TaxID=2613769 RepID=UPI002180A176|nr:MULTISPECIES: hypothetical protein [unclassified Rhizobium]